ncbi:MAG TPA: hypothetical protein VJC17_01460 [Candidatus Dojkabacteria bacterium]|nr:hypothetical protein [Candidatus Dojkabacteria bacterium]
MEALTSTPEYRSAQGFATTAQRLLTSINVTHDITLTKSQTYVIDVIIALDRGLTVNESTALYAQATYFRCQAISHVNPRRAVFKF